MKWMLRGIAAAVVCFTCATAQLAGTEAARKIDVAHSKMTVRVYKAGFFSALAHNHEIEAPIESGEVIEPGMALDSAATGAQNGGQSVELRVDARKLRVADPDTSAETRAKIQETMLGPQVLDAEKYPEIHFKSTTIDAKGADSWVVHGTLELHGQSHAVAVEVALKDGMYRGTAALKQTEFGIKPVSIAGGTVNVKDEVKIEFEIALL
jgi:YceI-like domain